MSFYYPTTNPACVKDTTDNEGYSAHHISENDARDVPLQDAIPFLRRTSQLLVGPLESRDSAANQDENVEYDDDCET